MKESSLLSTSLDLCQTMYSTVGAYPKCILLFRTSRRIMAMNGELTILKYFDYKIFLCQDGRPEFKLQTSCLKNLRNFVYIGNNERRFLNPQGHCSQGHTGRSGYRAGTRRHPIRKAPKGPLHLQKCFYYSII